jgi:hypothetical protein
MGSISTLFSDIRQAHRACAPEERRKRNIVVCALVGAMMVAPWLHPLLAQAQLQATPTSIAKNIVTDFGASCNGTGNDNPAFWAFNAWAREQTVPITLTIPSGSVCMFTSTNVPGNLIARGVKNLLVTGYGATFSDGPNGGGNGWFLGGAGVVQDNAHSARLATVTAGSSCVTLVNGAQTDLFTAGNYALISGVDMQGYGYPPNPYFYEYVKIASLGGGNVCFNAPLKNTYKSTWPVYNIGSDFEADQGGPATLYALDPSWDTEVEYDGLTFQMNDFQTYAVGRSITFRDVTFTGALCGVPTQNMNWTAINSDFSNCAMEVDKINDTVTLDTVKIRRVYFQSASVNVFNLINSTVTDSVNGTPKKFVGSGSAIASFVPGDVGYGVSTEVDCTNCVLNSITPAGNYDPVTAYTMSGGVITVPKSQGPVRWAVPGANMLWQGAFFQEPPAFQVLDVTADDTNTYVHTSLSGGFPPAPTYQGQLAVSSHPAPKFTCTNCTGSAFAIGVSQAPAGAPLGSYFQWTLDQNHVAAPAWVFGTLSSITFNVTKAYAGSGSPSVNLDGPFVINPDGSTVSIWNPAVNPKIAGIRTVTPTGVTGAQSGDSLNSPGASWLLSNQITAQFGSSVAGDGVSVTVQITTNQGVVNP